MNNKLKILSTIILVLIALTLVLAYNPLINDSQVSPQNNSSLQSKTNLTVNKTHYSHVYGNADVDIYRFNSKKPGPKYAFILGVHPYEWEAHQAFYDALSQFASSPEFKGQIDVYWVKVPDNVGENYDKGRETGERTAGYFIFSQIKNETKNGNYRAIFDIHSALKGYPYKGGPKWYFFPTPTVGSRNFSHNLSKTMNWAPTLENDYSYNTDSYDYHGEVLYQLAKGGVPVVVVEWGWCKPESLWLNEGKLNLKATDPGEYEDKLEHALIFLEKIETLS